MPKSTTQTSVTPTPPQPADKVKPKPNRTSKSKGDSTTALGTSIDPQTLPQTQNNRPKRAAATKTNTGEPPANKPQAGSTSRKRQADSGEDQSPTNAVLSTSETGVGEAPPPAKKTKKKASNDTGAQSNPVTTAGSKKNTSKKKGTSKPAPGNATKENVPPTPATTASKPKKATAAERREQQLNAADHAALEQRIRELEEENAGHRIVVERLERKNKRLDHRATQLASFNADSKFDKLIKEPEDTSLSLQSQMGLADDYKTYIRIQRTVRDLARRVLDFNQSWKKQDTIVVGDLFRAAAEKEPFLRRFQGHWATSKLAQMYLRNTRSYNTNIDIPSSAVAIRRTKTTKKGAEEAGLPPPDLPKKKKSTPKASRSPAAKKTSGKSSTSKTADSAARTKPQKGTLQAQEHLNDDEDSDLDEAVTTSRGGQNEENADAEGGEAPEDDDEGLGAGSGSGSGEDEEDEEDQENEKGDSEDDGEDEIMGDGDGAGDNGTSSDGCGDE